MTKWALMLSVFLWLVLGCFFFSFLEVDFFIDRINPTFMAVLASIHCDTQVRPI